MTQEEVSFVALVRDGCTLAEAYRRTHPKQAEGMRPSALRMAAKRLALRLGVSPGDAMPERQRVDVSHEVLEEVRRDVRCVLGERIADDGELQAGLTRLFREAVRHGDAAAAVRLAAELRAWKGLLPRDGGSALLPVGEVMQELNNLPYSSIAKDL